MRISVSFLMCLRRGGAADIRMVFHCKKLLRVRKKYVNEEEEEK